MDLHNNSATSGSVLKAQFLLLFRVWNVADGVSFVDMKSNMKPGESNMSF